jgi:hypothetical protein
MYLVFLEDLKIDTQNTIREIIWLYKFNDECLGLRMHNGFKYILVDRKTLKPVKKWYPDKEGYPITEGGYPALSEEHILVLAITKNEWDEYQISKNYILKTKGTYLRAYCGEKNKYDGGEVRTKEEDE